MSDVSTTPELRSIRADRPWAFWYATAADVPELSDPNQQYGRRWSEREEVRWRAVGEAVTDLLERFRPAEDGEELELVAAGARLTGFEWQLVRSFFDWHHAIRFDPWSEVPINGLQRMWCVWRELPDAVLPIRSDLFGFLDDLPIFALQTDAVRGLQGIPDDVNRRSPRYVAAMLDLSAGMLP